MSCGASSQEPSPTIVLSSVRVALLGGRSMDGGDASTPLEALGPSLAHRHRHRLQVPDQAEEGHELQSVIGDVEFPPIKALACRGRVVMVIVVPALAQI